jgi:hypothetical protein
MAWLLVTTGRPNSASNVSMIEDTLIAVQLRK